MRAIAWVAVAALTACGQSSGRDAATASDGGATAELPVEEAQPLAIEQLDERRFIIDAEVLVQLGVDHSAGRIAVARHERGYRIATLSGESVAARLGLVAGDLVRGINNVEMTAPSRLQRAWNRARRDQRVELLLERDGAVVELRWLFAPAVESQLSSFRSTFADRDRSSPQYAEVVKLARTGLERVALHRYKLDRAVLEALAAYPRLADRRLAGVWMARGGHRGVTVGAHSIYSALGVGRYDVVKAVGATDISGASDLAKILAEQAGASDLTISVVRLDDPVILRYELTSGVIDAAAWKTALETWKERDEARDLIDGRDPLSGPGSSRRPRFTPLAGVKQIDDRTFQLERSVLDKLADPSIARGARIVPSIKNGKPNGFKLYAIRPSSPQAQLGFKNGDTVEEINGRRLANPSDLIDIYARIKRARVITVEINRRGRPMTLTYKIKR